MTLSQALFIKWLRIRQEGTWRWVAIEYSKRYTGGYCNRALQEYDIYLCDKAMNLLNEKTEDGWN